MKLVIQWLEFIFRSIPLPLLEVWGRFGFLIGLILMISAYGRFTFRPRGHFKFGREKQTWDTMALLCMALTFALIVVTGFIGSSIVLVEGAQTFESLKDLSVFLCIVLFGYPALLIAPFAYGVSDLIEGVPPDFLRDWIFGYFINPACFWVAYQLLGREPDFKKLQTWKNYLLFVFIFMLIEPQLWGYICSGKYTSEISYRSITPALFFTTTVTWIMAPFVMLAAYPLAKKLGLFWSNIPGYVKEKPIRSKEWIWQTGKDNESLNLSDNQKLPIRLFLVTPFVFLVLLMVIATAYFTLRSAEKSDNVLGEKLHQEIAENIKLKLDNYFEQPKSELKNKNEWIELNKLLSNLNIAKIGRAYIIDSNGKLLSSSHSLKQDLLFKTAIQSLGPLASIKQSYLYRFDFVTAKPLSRETWLTHVTPYQEKSRMNRKWILMTIMPEAYYLAGIQTGSTHFAMVFALALLLSLVIATLLSTVVTNPICRISAASQKLAEGDLKVRVPGSRLNELDVLSGSFNNMARRLQFLFKDLNNEIEIRKKREQELKKSEALLRTSDSRLKLALKAGRLGIWDWDISNDVLIWDEGMYMQYGIQKGEFDNRLEGWESLLLPDDYERLTAEVQAAMRGEREYDTEFRVRWPDNSVHYIKGIAQTIRDEFGKPVRMVGINYDITKEKLAEEDLLLRKNALSELLKSRDEFLLIASHELKTPITALKLRLQILRKKVMEDKKLLNESDFLIAQINRLTKLIDNMLDVARIQSGKLLMDLTEVDLAELINEIVKQYGPQIAQAKCKVEINLKEDIIGHWDRSRLTQVIVNILTNALKYAQGSTIRISSAIYGDVTRLCIEDNGPGIPKTNQGELFKRFERAGASFSIGGLGLGLYICKQIIDSMGGKIAVESEEGKGTSFIIELPQSGLIGQESPPIWQ